jgi:Ca2+-binding EF-hand superfamily protein
MDQKISELVYDQYINSLSNEEKQTIKEIFELFDKNLDNGIDIKELKFILNCFFI